MSEMRYALISVSNKEGIVDFAQQLQELGIKIISTGGTGEKLKAAGISVIDIPQVTEYPEMLDGRVKTLHPAVHGGILADRSKTEHMQQLRELGIKPLDLIVVNLYPFAETIAQEGVSLAEAVENIDIGGPTMVRAAAKNFEHVTVVVDPTDYQAVLDKLKTDQLSKADRLELSYKAFAHTAEYDHLIQDYLAGLKKEQDGFPEVIRDRYQKINDLRYGENPHQQAAFYSANQSQEDSVATAKQLHGKDLSFNNINDTNAALELVKEFKSKPAVAVIKHANPCGMAIADSLLTAYQQAYSGDPMSAYGSIVALNREVDLKTAQEMTGPDRFVEVVIAPGFEDEALKILKERWESVRLLETGELGGEVNPGEKDFKKVTGGLLVQDRDLATITKEDLEVVSDREPTEAELKDLLFSWQVVKHVKSNAIVLAKNEMVLGVGAGQMSRVDALTIAQLKAGAEKEGSVVASDAFLPFKDVLVEAVKAGATAIIQPGGSIRDEEIVELANQHDLAMVFTGRRHFKH
ncbi:bifunctional phosphoribosylaminoimidazolecarboxamide formyltransferase/IMP cyclohydrolase [Fuchsiella alkaliacetigena]|uniref:bifunctional phosphoribosylaminoimidazolecarboxamide formyltransferase/IMP cyclohydrolase n=1 Tax=Fuchsiella alkaliacetigena TaxID=957042 RepID=UPI00200AB80B|nr:bifunctional phosphoribosylaminoimidazolecarboxamide formyltransferase/IMP cyclohydrolase [Fuchsiella alkaliacetigena]MCK8825691.1 bifunctional phosphoribosylaminoimidazolecarboxamide formyltransferase/IMP cyclohydrolase [Fuchsiella alkaliacetigena]